jgi:hypothetical protein
LQRTADLTACAMIKRWKPPFAVTGLGPNSGIFDSIGRLFCAGASAKF